MESVLESMSECMLERKLIKLVKDWANGLGVEWDRMLETERA